MIDRFRVMPMSRLALVVGRTLSDSVIQILALLVMSLTGLAIGWRIHERFWLALGGYVVVLFFGLPCRGSALS
ncbi:ABC transporter permease [Nocardia sp. 348MFTsu5.1]|uniref:ABC transporter permease n=1 Tax=Nocardia sp. 348MFTsu5.1 TaxID=1172185 RepID=UPI00039C76CF|nr:ABC transporter permease [Nocardia sp. 348MFTsu5.1]